MFDQWKLEGLKIGKMMSKVRGTIEVTPRMVANLAPSRIPR